LVCPFHLPIRGPIFLILRVCTERLDLFTFLTTLLLPSFFFRLFLSLPIGGWKNCPPAGCQGFSCVASMPLVCRCLFFRTSLFLLVTRAVLPKRPKTLFFSSGVFFAFLHTLFTFKLPLHRARRCGSNFLPFRFLFSPFFCVV